MTEDDLLEELVLTEPQLSKRLTPAQAEELLAELRRRFGDTNDGTPSS